MEAERIERERLAAEKKAKEEAEALKMRLEMEEIAR
jgi:hypothetical protein